MKKYIIIALTGLLVSSCGILKDYERPADIKTDGIYGSAQSGDSLGLGDLKWREVFTDPTLQSLIEKTLEQNTNMRNADLQIQEVEYALKASKTAFAPSIYFTPSIGISKMWDPSDRSMYSAMTSGNSKTYSLPVTAGWQNVNFLKLRNQKRGAEVSLEQMQNIKQSIQTALVCNVASLYYTLAELDEQKALLTQTRDNWKQYLDMQRALMDAGQSNIAAVSSIEATYYSICSSLVTIDDNIRIIENSLSTLMGESATSVSRSALASFRAPALLTTGAPISILTRRPDVRAAELNLASKFYDVNKAKASFFPSLNLTATGTYTNSLGSAIINPGMMIGNALMSLTQPIFANGALRAQYKVSQAEMEIACNDFQQAVIAAGNEVNTAMVKLHSAEEQKVLVQNQITALETALHATKLLMENTSANYLQVITAQNSLLSAQTQMISNRMEAISATIELYQALGGGAE